MGSVIKANQYQQINRSINELDQFILEEMRDHLEQLTESAQDDAPDLEKVEYHHEKIKLFLNRIEMSLGGHASG